MPNLTRWPIPSTVWTTRSQVLFFVISISSRNSSLRWLRERFTITMPMPPIWLTAVLSMARIIWLFPQKWSFLVKLILDTIRLSVSVADYRIHRNSHPYRPRHHVVYGHLSEKVPRTFEVLGIFRISGRDWRKIEIFHFSYTNWMVIWSVVILG